MTKKELLFLIDKRQLVCGSCGNVLTVDKYKISIIRRGLIEYDNYGMHFCSNECINTYKRHLSITG